MKRASKTPAIVSTRSVLIVVDESNVVSSVRAMSRKLDWEALRASLAREEEGRRLIETVVYSGLPPAMPEWQAERDKKNKFLHWLRSHGFLVVAKDGSPQDATHYKANVDVLMTVDVLELCEAMKPEIVVMVTGDADFAPLAYHLRRQGIRVEVAATAAIMGAGLRGSANEVIDLTPLFESAEVLKGRDE